MFLKALKYRIVEYFKNRNKTTFTDLFLIYVFGLFINLNSSINSKLNFNYFVEIA